VQFFAFRTNGRPGLVARLVAEAMDCMIDFNETCMRAYLHLFVTHDDDSVIDSAPAMRLS
jgi:hypothetical protein